MNRFVTGLLLSIVIVATFAAGQDSTSSTKNKAQSSALQKGASKGNLPDTEASPNTNTRPVSDFGTNLANSVVSATSDPVDQVPCFFTLKQLMDLRPMPDVARLTAADQSRVLTSVVEAVDAASDTELTRPQKREFIETLAGELDGKLIGKTPGEALATIMNILYQITAEHTDLYKAAAASNEEPLLDLLPKYGATSSVQNNAKGQSKVWFKPNDPKSTLSELASIVAQESPTLASTLDQASSVQSAGSQVNGAVVTSARSAINKFARPDDIGCAYQILSWNESRLLFGRSVANNFISVQVTVRNLNAKEEFIVHNAMLSVDTDIHGAIGKYLEGVDKIGVEAYNNAGESLTARGIIGNSITAASTLLSTLQPIVNVANFSNAVAAFNGGVPKGWTTLSPDHQKDQLLLIANSGFSATYTTKTIVGKSGAATFYTWFPAKPFLEGWWVQDCAQGIVTVGDDTSDKGNNSSTTDTTAGDKPQGSGEISPQLGVDLKRARKVCAGVTASNWKTISYQKWSPVSDQLFRDLSLAVVAGIHVQEDSKNKSSITDLKCPKNARGELDFSKASSDGTLSCDVTGDNLDKVSKLRLENAGNSVDPVRPDATVTVSGDNTSAKAAFKVSDLASAPGDTYNVYAVGKDGTETPTGLNVHLDTKDISLTGVDPTKIDLSSVPSKVTLTGYNLNNLNKVCFSGSMANKPTADVKKDSSKTQVTIDSASLKPLTAGEWEIYLNDCSDANDSKQKLTVTGALAPKIDSFTPLSAAPGQTVTINGSNFTGAASVTFGGVAAMSPSVEDSKITAKVPTGAKSGSIEVTTTPGNTAKSKDTFKVLPKGKTANPKLPAAKPQ